MNALATSERYDDILARQRDDYAGALLRATRRLRWSADRLACERQKRLTELTLLSEPCSCGCAHRRIANIAVRSTSFFVYGDGTAVHWLGMMSIMLSTDWVAEYHVQQTLRGADLLVVLRRPHELEGLRADFARVLARSGLVDPRVTVSEVANLPRLHSGKLQQFCPLAPREMAGS